MEGLSLCLYKVSNALLSHLPSTRILHCHRFLWIIFPPCLLDHSPRPYKWSLTPLVLRKKKKKKKNFLSLSHPFIIPIFITDPLNYCLYSQCPTENQPAILLASVYKSISSWFKKAPYLNRISAKTYISAKTSSGFPELVLFFIGYTTKQLRGSF